MIGLEVFGKSSEMARVAELLEDLAGVSRVRLVPAMHRAVTRRRESSSTSVPV